MSDIQYVDLLTDEQKDALEDEKDNFLSQWEDSCCTCFRNPPCSYCTRFGDEAYYTERTCRELESQPNKVDEYNCFMAYYQWLERAGEES